MSLTTVTDTLSTRTYETSARTITTVRAKFDNAVVRYDAWFLVFVAVILALGAVLITGMALWCVIKQHKTFTGRWSFRNFGLNVYFECR